MVRGDDVRFMNISTSVDDGKYRASRNYVLRVGRPKYASIAARESFPSEEYYLATVGVVVRRSEREVARKHCSDRATTNTYAELVQKLRVRALCLSNAGRCCSRPGSSSRRCSKNPRGGRCLFRNRLPQFEVYNETSAWSTHVVADARHITHLRAPRDFATFVNSPSRGLYSATRYMQEAS